MQLATLDLVIIVIYAIGLFTLAQWVSRERAGQEKDSAEYFLASKTLPWWAIGASLISEYLGRANRRHVGIGLCHRARDRFL
jgi:SSS family solute:Na+ symporter